MCGVPQEVGSLPSEERIKGCWAVQTGLLELLGPLSVLKEGRRPPFIKYEEYHKVLSP